MDTKKEESQNQTEKKYEVIRPYTDEAINEHAAKSGGRRNLKEVIVTTDDDYQFHYLVKRPSRHVLQAVAQKEEKKDTDGIQKLMYGCVLEGDTQAAEADGAIYSQLLLAIGNLAQTAKNELKKV